MTREEIDRTVFDGTITTTTNEVFTVDTARADAVVLLIDDGTTDGTPPTYDLIERVYTTEIDDYQLYDELTGETARSWTGKAFGDKMQFEFNNQSASDATYRIVIKTYRSV